MVRCCSVVLRLGMVFNGPIYKHTFTALEMVVNCQIAAMAVITPTIALLIVI